MQVFFLRNPNGVRKGYLGNNGYMHKSLCLNKKKIKPLSTDFIT